MATAQHTATLDISERESVDPSWIPVTRLHIADYSKEFWIHIKERGQYYSCRRIDVPSKHNKVSQYEEEC